jgi:hypothetical protein
MIMGMIGETLREGLSACTAARGVGRRVEESVQCMCIVCMVQLVLMWIKQQFVCAVVVAGRGTWGPCWCGISVELIRINCLVASTTAGGRVSESQ